MSLRPLPIVVRLATALVVGGCGAALGDGVLGIHAVGWYGAFLLNFRLMSGMAGGTAGSPSMALVWGLKLPVTLAAAGLFLAWSSPLAMVLGLIGAVHALLAGILLGPPVVAVRLAREP